MAASLRNDARSDSVSDGGGGFARLSSAVATLDAIKAVHGCSLDNRWPSFSQWFRGQVVRSVRRFVEVSCVTNPKLQELTGLVEPTVRKLLQGKSTPQAATICRLMAAGIIDVVDGAPNLAYARQLRPVRHRLLGQQGPHWNWGVAEAIREWRKARGHSQVDCVSLFGASSQRILSHWERGHALPGARALARLVHLRVIDKRTALAIVDSDHYPKPVSRAQFNAYLEAVVKP